MKQRFSTLDVAAAVAELQGPLVGLRLQNIYDLNSKTYLLKFAREGIKEFLLIESGIRMHSTVFARDKSDSPSGFCMKLRKHLRTKRLSSLNQLGMDRVVDLKFGENETAYHLIIEFYASGNIILTDASYKILSLLRLVTIATGGDSVPPVISDTPTAKETQKEKGSKQGSSEKIDDDNIRVAVGEVYDTGRSRGFERMTPEGLLKVLQTSSASLVQNNEPAVVAVKKSGKGKDKGGEDVASIKKILRSQLGTDYGLSILDHIVSLSKLEPNLKVSQEWLDLENYTFKALYGAFLLGDEIVVSCQTQKQKGWIYAKSHPGQEKPKEGSTESIDHKDFLEYEDLHPFPLDSGKKDLIRIEYESFNKAADTYFSSLESQKLEMKARQAQSHADKKLEAVKTGHATQIAGLAALQEKSELHARAIELHLDEIESLLRTIRGFVASGMDWIDLAELIKDEARKGNPLARLVDKLKLEVSMVSIKLPDPSLEHNSSDEDDSDSSESDSEDDDPVNIKTKKRQFTFKTDTSLKIDLDIYSTAYANARKYFESRKVAAVKQEKTIVAAEKALKSSEKKIEAELKAATQLVPTTILKIRKPFWFEKFLWFISSENYLVIGGRDAAQNELLVKRYLKKDDAYVHADLYGASSVVIKNISTDPIPETTLAQAGTMSVVQSKAWDSKIVTSAWWVSASQVSKTAPSGEYLTTGSFMIRGKKNWLPPVQLIYGFGLLFRVDETSVGRHFYERRPWARLGDNEESPIIGKYASAQSLQSSAASTVEPEGSVDDQKTSPDNSDAELEDQKEVAADDNQHQTQDIQDQSSESEEEEFPDTQLDISTDKYNLSGLQDALTDSYHPTGSEARKGPVKHISAKQRRDMKKGKPSGTALPVQSEGSVSPKPADGDDDGQPPTKATPLPRGKKGKMKKMKDKYKDQDDEDRERILDFLGAAQGPQPKGKKAKAAAAKKAQSDEYKARREQEYEEKEQKASRKENSTKEQAEIQRMLEEENVALPDEEQMADLTYLDSLTGEPHSADILLNAVPVCAPWNTLGKYKYRVKLTPGGLKKGKAAKAVMSSFLHTASKSEETKRELELIKGLQDNEVIQQILGKVKVLGTSDDKKKGKK